MSHTTFRSSLECSREPAPARILCASSSPFAGGDVEPETSVLTLGFRTCWPNPKPGVQQDARAPRGPCQGAALGCRAGALPSESVQRCYVLLPGLPLLRPPFCCSRSRRLFVCTRMGWASTVCRMRKPRRTCRHACCQTQKRCSHGTSWSLYLLGTRIPCLVSA